MLVSFNCLVDDDASSHKYIDGMKLRNQLGNCTIYDTIYYTPGKVLVHMSIKADWVFVRPLWIALLGFTIVYIFTEQLFNWINIIFVLALIGDLFTNGYLVYKMFQWGARKKKYKGRFQRISDTEVLRWFIDNGTERHNPVIL